MSTKTFGRVVIGATVALLIPLIAAQFVDGFVWTFSDFVFAWIMFIGFGSGLTLLFGRSSDTRKRIMGAVLALLLVWLWIEFAVGLFTTWGD